VRESSQLALPRWTKPSAFSANGYADGRQALADVHGDRTDDHTAAGIIHSVVEEHEDGDAA
jgi:hypothetical protein